ncbi:hypothetical protein JY651_44525 [Pyxidicoccus parkwayensis]|uniref:Lipoprotein n=1 Tax=Pyxidicoccus parkwayensis TaxID=2813578 RepID=A0ABX7NUP2_9BACT|nr:hypothetical protein [Pyxidicoccus parkwaysis]QSQ22131.1 hypothetical protein JY651_44525 [Pyxidicoccus parkwaysis]
MRKPAQWLMAALLLAGAVGCGSADVAREDSRLPETVVQAASDDPRLPEGTVRTLDLNALGRGCRVDATCGDLVGVDCGQDVDGPYYYVEKPTGRIVEYCGGACMLGPSPDSPLCRHCPPLGWTCKGQQP